MLLYSSMNLLAKNEDNIPSTGEIIKSDTTVIIPINLIRQANAKMIERLYLLNILNEQDSIINMKDNYINTQSFVISDFQKKVNEVNKLNESIEQELHKQKLKTNKLFGISSTIIIALIFGLLCK